MTGGQLDWQVGEGGRLDNIDFKLVAGGGSPLTVFLLTTHGRISVWGENRENSFIPCLFSLSRELIVADISVHKAGLLVVGKGGEAWTGTHQQGRTAKPGSKTTTRDLIKLKRLPHIHRAVMSISDAKGRNFCILQVAPNEALTVVPEVSLAQMREHMTSLLNEVSEQDTIHDVICQVGEKRFPAHSFVLASGSESLSKQLRFLENSMDEELVVQVEDVHPETFHLVLQFLYTKACDIFVEGAPALPLNIGVQDGEQDILTVQGNPGQVSAFQVYKENKNRKKKSSGKGKSRADIESEARRMRSRCPLALLVEAAKSLGIYGLAKTADFFKVVDGVIVKKSSNSTTAQDSDTSFEELQQNVEDKADKERTETESSDPFESMVIVNNAIDKDGLDISREKTADLVALRTAISVDLSPDTIIVVQKENHMIEVG